jgi:hypothetical protein
MIMNSGFQFGHLEELARIRSKNFRTGDCLLVGRLGVNVSLLDSDSTAGPPVDPFVRSMCVPGEDKGSAVILSSSPLSEASAELKRKTWRCQ